MSRPCTWTFLTAASVPRGITSTRSPGATAPLRRVPVTTVPIPGKQRTDLLACELPRFDRRPIALGQRCDPVPDPQCLEHRQVLAGLWHDALIRRDHQQEQVHARGAGGHRADEALVTRDVDYPQRTAPRQDELRESELDRQPPPALLGEPVRVHPGERLDQGRLAMVDVV